LANNSLGELVLPADWTKEYMYDKFQGDGYKHTDGREQKEHPGKPDSIIAIADAIPDMRALSKLIFGGDGWKSPLVGWAIPEPEPANSPEIRGGSQRKCTPKPPPGSAFPPPSCTSIDSSSQNLAVSGRL
jgi:hypothetical protein